MYEAYTVIPKETYNLLLEMPEKHRNLMISFLEKNQFNLDVANKAVLYELGKIQFEDLTPDVIEEYLKLYTCFFNSDEVLENSPKITGLISRCNSVISLPQNNYKLNQIMLLPYITPQIIKPLQRCGIHYLYQLDGLTLSQILEFKGVGNITLQKLWKAVLDYNKAAQTEEKITLTNDLDF